MNAIFHLLQKISLKEKTATAWRNTILLLFLGFIFLRYAMIPKLHRYRKNRVVVQSFIGALVNYESLVFLFLKLLDSQLKYDKDLVSRNYHN